MQQFTKDIILTVHELGHGQTVYLSVELLAAIISIAFCAWFGKKIGIGTQKTLLAECLGIVSVFTEMALFRTTIAWAIRDYIPVMNSYFQNVGRTVILVLFRTFWVSKLLKIEFTKLSSVFALTQAITWGISCLACLFPGCCSGYPWEHDIYNVREQTFLFPTQLINASMLVLTATIMVNRIKKNNYVVTGEEAPTIMILIGTIRFLTEFLMNNNKIILGLSSLSFDSMIMCFAGLVPLYIMRKRKIERIKRNIE